MSIPNHILEQLNSQADLVSIIGKHTTLKRAGNEFKGCCPFHGEKSPSFYVNPQKNIYHCFGCSVGGNAISFLRDYESLTFIEAVNELSNQTGIEVPKEERQNVSYQRSAPKPIAPPPIAKPAISVKPPTQTRREPSAGAASDSQVPHHNTDHSSDQSTDQSINGYTDNYDSQPHYGDSSNNYDDYPPLDAYDSAPYPTDGYDLEYQSDTSHPPAWITDGNESTSLQGIDSSSDKDGNLYELLEQIQQFYQHSLTTHPHAMQYFLSRGITEDIFDTFGLGYAPFGWQHLEHQFPQDIEGLKALGLVRQSESGRDYDLLRDRVIFPIRDNQGRTIGFGGRALDDEVKPKYINSSDSPVFHKQHVLYGYYESRQQRANDWLVVEGYMDVIALYQAGIYGAIASMGTAINESQISRLLTLNPTLTLSFDGDSAGQKAAWRTLEVALPVLADDKELRFLTLPNNHDPDTFIKSQGSDAMREQITNAMPLSQYIFAYLSERYDLSLAEGKAKLMSQVRSLTTALPKGSSFRYLLNNDVYQKLGGKRSQNVEAKDALLDFDGDMTISQQLQLCFLFQPRALIEDPIEYIWRQSGLTSLKLPAHIQKKAASDALRAVAWEDLQDVALLDVVTTIKRCIKHLPTDANAAAHFVLSNLNPTSQATLSNSWGGFYRALTARNVLSLDDLIEELVSSLLERNIKKKMQELIKNPDHIKQAIVRMQAQHLSNWLRAQHAERSSQMVTVQS
ncbi:toprim domain-containing protein [Psychrobacter sp. NG254]|uniref:DNA primase n=1 Tax=Psychrobacter sp. NG254 TaxID=2782003 RepID=UPI00188744B2|nr:CHC2 zinc finger domain-containing protein [Psychrobacter sp. NG254]MBF2718649.1 toprim domain-containing protein [Psychrobacter sp. NG254]